MIKRLYFIVSVMLAYIVCFSTSFYTVRAEVLSDSLIMVLVANHDSNYVDIDVNLVKNTGIAGMVLTLDYRQDVFEFVSYEEGAALGKLNLMVTELTEDKTIPIVFNWLSNDGPFNNDDSEGNVLKLRFALKEGVPSGKYSIGFGNERQIMYVENGNLGYKSAMISKVLLSVEENAIAETETVDESSQSSISGGWIAGIIISSAALLTFATLLVVKIFKSKRGKGNWSKI